MDGCAARHQPAQPPVFDVYNLHSSSHRRTDVHRSLEAEVLTHVHGARDGSSEQGGEQTRHEDTVNNSASKHRGFREFRIRMQRIVVTTEASELVDMVLRKSVNDLRIQSNSDGTFGQQGAGHIETSSP